MADQYFQNGCTLPILRLIERSMDRPIHFQQKSIGGPEEMRELLKLIREGALIGTIDETMNLDQTVAHVERIAPLGTEILVGKTPGLIEEIHAMLPLELEREIHSGIAGNPRFELAKKRLAELESKKDSQDHARHQETVEVAKGANALSEKANSISEAANAKSDKANSLAHRANLSAFGAIGVSLIVGVVSVLYSREQVRVARESLSASIQATVASQLSQGSPAPTPLQTTKSAGQAAQSSPSSAKTTISATPGPTLPTPARTP